MNNEYTILKEWVHIKFKLELTLSNGLYTAWRKFYFLKDEEMFTQLRKSMTDGLCLDNRKNSPLYVATDVNIQSLPVVTKGTAVRVYNHEDGDDMTQHVVDMVQFSENGYGFLCDNGKVLTADSFYTVLVIKKTEDYWKMRRRDRENFEKRIEALSKA